MTIKFVRRRLLKLRWPLLETPVFTAVPTSPATSVAVVMGGGVLVVGADMLWRIGIPTAGCLLMRIRKRPTNVFKWSEFDGFANGTAPGVRRERCLRFGCVAESARSQSTDKVENGADLRHSLKIICFKSMN
jgi:hypothetical protein